MTEKVQQVPEKRENIFLSLILNIAIPTLILTKASKEEYLGTFWALIIALIFPVAYGVADLIRRRKYNVFSILGVVSLLLTGVIGLVELDAKWLAIKEAAIPLFIGIFVLLSMRTRFPLVKMIFYNDTILDLQKVDAALDLKGVRDQFVRRLDNVSYMLAGSFFLSSVLNYVLARWVVTSESGTEAFNEELGRMIALSYPVIVIPSMVIMIIALWYLFAGIMKMTGLEFDEIIRVKESGKENKKE